MAKKNKNDIDIDLDFGLDGDDFNFDSEFTAESRPSGKRAVAADVFKGTISGMKSKFTDPEFLGKSVRKSLPKSYDTVFNEVDGVTTNISKTYKTAVDELKPQLAGIATSVNKIVPSSLNSVKKLTDKIDKYFSGDNTGMQDNRANVENMAISSALGEIFGQQSEVDKKERAEDKAETRVRDAIEDKRFKSQAGLLGKIADYTGKMSSLAETVDLGYKKKSLEVQLRTLFALQNLTEKSIKFQEVSTVQNENIVKNTAMPEFVKLKESERFKEVARNKFYGKMQSQLMEMTGLSKISGRIAKDAGDYIKGLKQGLSGGREMAEMIREQLESMNDAGDIGLSKAEIAGNMLGGGAAGKLRDFLTSNIRETLDETPGAVKAGHRASTMLMNAGAYGKRFRNSNKMDDLRYGGGIKGKLGDVLDYFLSKTGDDGPDMRLKDRANLGNLQEPGVITNKFIRSVEEVIPSWLASIHRELTYTRTGTDPGLSSFDFRKGSIISKSDKTKDTIDRIRDASSSSINKTYMEEAYKKYVGDEKVSPEQEMALKGFLFNLSNEKDIVFDDRGISGSRSYSSLDKNTKGLVDKLNKRYSETDESAEKAEREFDLTAAMRNVKGTKVDMRALLEELILNNDLDALLEDGIVFYTPDGALDINFDKYMEYAREGYFGTSDRNKKKNIRSLKAGARKLQRKFGRFAKSDVNSKNVDGKVDTSNALNKLRGVRVDSWEYKDGQGEPGTKIGPMAQDVKEKMGNNVAPNGTKIDLVSMNGINMAATQELADRVDSFFGGEGGDSYLKLISDNTSRIADLLESKFSGAFSEMVSSGAGMVGQGARKAGSLFGKAIGNSYNIAKGTVKGGLRGAKGIAGYAKDVFIDPALAYINDGDNKKAVTSAIGGAIQNTLKFGGMALGQLNKTIFDRIPKAFGFVKDKMKSLLGKLYDGILGPMDMWVKGRAEPAIRAVRLQAGEYIDSATNKVLKTVKDIQSSKGDIVDSTGKIVLTVKELNEGLIDRFGKEIKTKAVNALQLGVYGVGKLAGGALNLAKKAGNKLKGMLGIGDGRFSEMTAAVSDSLKNTFGDIGFGVSKEANTAIIDIRDLFYRLHPKEAEDVEKSKKSAKGDDTKRAGGIGKMIKKYLKLGDKKAKSITESIKGLAAGTGGAITPEISQKLQSLGIPQSAIDKAGGMLGKLGGFLKGKSADKDAPEIAGPTMPTTVAAKRGIADRLGNSKWGQKLAGSKIGGKLGGLFGKVAGSKLGLGVKGLLGGAASAIGGLFGGGDKPAMGAPEQDGNLAQEGAKQSGRIIDTTGDASKGPTFNDKDGDGKRAGNALDIQAKMEAEKAERLKAKKLAAADVKYRGDNVVDKLFAGAGKIISGITELAGGILSTAAGFLGKGKAAIAGKLGKFAGLKGLLSKGLGKLGIGAGAKGAATAGAAAATTGAKAGAGLLSRAGGAMSSLLKKAPGIATALAVANGAYDVYKSESSDMSRDEKDKATGGAIGNTGGMLAGGSAGAKLGAAIGAIGGPVGIAIGGAVGGVGGAIIGSKYGKALGEYAGGLWSKFRKYVGFSATTDLEMIRMYQYGLGHTEISKKHITEVTKLENYLLDGRIKYDANKIVTLDDKKVDFKEVLSIIEVSEKDRIGVENAQSWFNERFTPVFCHHVSILYFANSKAKLADLNTLNKNEKLTYLEKADFKECLYRLNESPWQNVPSLNTDPKFSEVCTYNARIEFTDPNKEKLKSPPMKAVTPDADRDAQSLASRREKEEAKANYDKAAELSAKHNALINKSGSKDGIQSGPVGEDGPQPELGKGTEGKREASASGLSMPSSLPLAPGGLKDGSSGLQYVVFNKKDVNIDSMNPAMKRQLLGMIQEYGEATGKKVIITSGTRTNAEQAALYKANPAKAARPGRSLHEFGIAVDINTADADAMDKMGLMRKYGFTRPVGGETWHVEPAGIQGNVGGAKNDPNLASNMVVQGAGLGGAGIGSIRGSKLGSRDPNAAKSLLAASDKTVDIAKNADFSGPGKNMEFNIPKRAALPQGVMSSGSMMPASYTPINDALKTSEKSDLKGNSSAGTPKSPNSNVANTMAEPEAKPSTTGSTVPGVSVSGGEGGEKGGLEGTIEKGARKVNMDPNMMKAFAAVESSMNPKAAARGTSAKGLYQFLDATWNEQVGKNASKHGLGRGVSPFDPYSATIIAGEYLKTNLKTVSSVKKDTNIVDAYLTHFLGPGGARTFLSAGRDRIAAEILPSAARSNKNIFFNGNKPRTIGEVYDFLKNKILAKAKAFGISVDAGSSSSLGKSESQQNVDKVTTSTGTLPTPSYTGNGRAPVAEQDQSGNSGAGMYNTSTASPSDRANPVVRRPSFERFEPAADQVRADRSMDPSRAVVESESHLKQLVSINSDHLAVTRELLEFMKQELPTLLGAKVSDSKNGKEAAPSASTAAKPGKSEEYKVPEKAKPAPTPAMNVGRRPLTV